MIAKFSFKNLVVLVVNQAEYFACLGEIVLDNTTIKELKGTVSLILSVDEYIF